MCSLCNRSNQIANLCSHVRSSRASLARLSRFPPLRTPATQVMVIFSPQGRVVMGWRGGGWILPELLGGGPGVGVRGLLTKTFIL